MGTMRNNFATVFVLHALMLSTSQSLPHGYENSSRRNSLADDLTIDDRTTSYPIHNCLFIDPDLPICDVERMLSSDEKGTGSTSNQRFDEDFLTRSRRNADVSATTRVVVYTIEGCRPPRLPFSLPSCHGISLDNIVDVQRLRPFAVKGVTQSPFIFPEFNYTKWIRMMTRLQSHVSSNKQDEEENTVPKEISIEDFPQNVATTKKTILNTSSPNKHHLLGQKLIKSKSKNYKSKIDRISSSKSRKFGLRESQDSSASFSIEDANNNSEINSRNTNDRFSGMELSLEKSRQSLKSQNPRKFEEQRGINDNRARNVWDWNEEQNQSATPTIPLASTSARRSNALISKDGSFNEQSVVDEPSNHLGSGGNSKSFLEMTEEEENEAWNEALLSELRFFGRKRREIRLSGEHSLQGIADESKTRGIAGKSIARRFQDERFKETSRSNLFEDKNHSKSLNAEQRGIVDVRDVSTTAIPGLNTQNHGKKSKLDNPRLKIDLASSKASWRRALMKEAALGKKHRNYMELSTSRSQ